MNTSYFPVVRCEGGREEEDEDDNLRVLVLKQCGSLAFSGCMHLKKLTKVPPFYFLEDFF